MKRRIVLLSIIVLLVLLVVTSFSLANTRGGGSVVCEDQGQITCSNEQQCMETDEIFSDIADLIGTDGKVWVPQTKEGLGKSADFEDVYCENEIVVTGSVSGVGDDGTHGDGVSDPTEGLGPAISCTYLDSRTSDFETSYPSADFVDYRKRFCDATNGILNNRKYSKDGISTIEKVVLHYTVTFDAEAALGVWESGRNVASAHYIIDEDGEITYVVDEKDRAWHAGCKSSESSCLIHGINSKSIGIEIVNLGFDCDKYSSECESSKQYDGKNWEEYKQPQLDALYKLSSYLAIKYGLDVDTDFIGHEDVITRKSDPGPAFDWAKFRSEVGASAQTGKLVGTCAEGFTTLDSGDCYDNYPVDYAFGGDYFNLYTNYIDDELEDIFFVDNNNIINIDDADHPDYGGFPINGVYVDKDYKQKWEDLSNDISACTEVADGIYPIIVYDHFCCREIAGKGILSNHAYGSAIDFNVPDNPYTSGRACQASDCDITSCVLEAIYDNGFQWGGAWNSLCDPHHIEYDLTKSSNVDPSNFGFCNSIYEP